MRITSTIFVCFLLAACGEVHSFTDAGGGGDDTIDATTTDAATVGPVNVTVLTRCCTNPNAGVADAEVISVDPDGAQRDRAQSDAAGAATVDVERGGSVTVLYPYDAPSNAYNLVTIAAVEPGDDLTFGERFTVGTGAALGTMRVTWPAGVPNVSQWNVYTNCSGWGVVGAATEVVITKYDYSYCLTPTTDIVLIGYDSTLGIWARHGTLQDVTWVDNGVVSFTGTQLQTNTVNWNITGLPPEVDYLYSYANPMLGQVYLPGNGVSGTPSGGTFTGSVQMPPIGDHLDVSLELNRTGDFGYQFTRRRLPAGTTQLTMADPLILPWVGAAASSTAARTITWIQLGETPYDLAHVDFYWYGGSPGLFGLGTPYHQWDLYLPPGVDELQFPPMPADLMEYAPPPDVNIYPGIELVESDLYDGYTDARTHPEWDLRCPSCVPETATDYPDTTYSEGGSGGKLTDALPGGWMGALRAGKPRARR